MKKGLLALIVAGPVVVVAIGVAVMRGRAPAPPPPIAAGALRGANVLLVTIDTLRADHVGVYGSSGSLTPTIDQFATEGLRFERTYAHVPLTLPSHASLLTASYPTRNGVHDNGTFRLRGAPPPTLAEALHRAGYRTAAFVGAFVLDARFGLGRGFDLYDDRMLGSGADLEVVQRTAEQVLGPAFQWITAGNGAAGNGAAGNGAAGNGARVPGSRVPGAASQSAMVPGAGVTGGTLARGTVAPGTPAPGTLARGTLAPGTPAPGTLAPGTPAPGTLAPGTPAPGTPAPGTLAPGTLAPGTPAPGTLAPGTLAPGTPAPGTLAPGTPAPGTLARGTLARGTLAPGTPAPGTLAPGTPAPGTPAPGTLARGTLAPGTLEPGALEPGTLEPGALEPGTVSAAPWFAWVHLYDPHEPYAPPEPYKSRYESEPYDGEIAYTDAALGMFVAQLRRAQALDNTLVVIASDHGESLGEHGERTHGLFAYDATLRVPLIMWAPPRLRPGVFRETMRLVDVAPTMLDLIGAEGMDGVDGRSVRPFVGGGRPFDHAASYFEALDANLTRGWAPLTGIVRDRLKVIDLPIPELYDLVSDPGEQHNLYGQQRDRARDLEAALDRIAKSAAPIAPSPIGADAEARLRALGYVVSPAKPPARRYGTADDPKQLVAINASLDEAAAMWTRGDASGAIGTLRRVIGERPDLAVAYDRLAFMLRASGRVGDAVALLDGAARAGHADRALLRSLGSMLRDAGNLPRSASVLEDLVRADAGDLESADALGQTYTYMGRSKEAEAQFRRVLAASPNDAAAWNNLGSLFLAAGRGPEAKTALLRAVEIDPALAGAHNGLGVVYARSGDIPRAVAEWKRALELRPDLADARSNLDRVRK